MPLVIYNLEDGQTHILTRMKKMILHTTYYTCTYHITNERMDKIHTNFMNIPHRACLGLHQ